MDNFSTGKRSTISHLINNPNFELIEGDIRDFERCSQAMKNINVVLHQAALGSVPRSINNPITTNEVNINGFLNVLWAAKESNVERFVYAASSSTYGDQSELPKIEERIGNPLSPYAVTKLVNEKYADVFSKIYGIKTIGLRYFNVFGKNQDPEGQYAAAIPKFIKALINHQSPVIYGDGNQSRDFTYISNVIEANELAILTSNDKAVNQVYNVAYGKNTTLNQLLEILKELLSEYDNAINSVSICYESERIGDIKHSLASIDKAKSFLGYNPKYDLKMGLTEAIKWYWENLKNKQL